MEGIEFMTILYMFDVFPSVAMFTETGHFTCVRGLQFGGDVPVLGRFSVIGRSARLLCSTVLLWWVSQFWERSLGLVDPRVTCALQF